MEFIILIVVGWLGYLFFSMLRKNKNPSNQQCSNGIAAYILSGHFHSSAETAAEIKKIVSKYKTDYFDGPHIASLVELRLREHGAWSESTKRLLKDIYLN